MPIYEFHCAACKKDSEILVRSSTETDEIFLPSEMNDALSL